MPEISSEQLKRTIVLLECAESSMWNTQYDLWSSADRKIPFKKSVIGITQECLGAIRSQIEMLYKLLEDNNV